jgi:hypothetical protein
MALVNGERNDETSFQGVYATSHQGECERGGQWNTVETRYKNTARDRPKLRISRGYSYIFGGHTKKTHSGPRDWLRISRFILGYSYIEYSYSEVVLYYPRLKGGKT